MNEAQARQARAKRNPENLYQRQHVFRHTFATWAYERAQDPRKLQRLLRHASFQTSMGYVHDRSELSDILDRMPALSRARLRAA
jgi:integrase